VHATPASYLDLEEDEEEDVSDDEDDVPQDAGELMDLYPEEVIFGAGLEFDHGFDHHGFPRIATTRNNLTALSQKYNVCTSAVARCRCLC